MNGYLTSALVGALFLVGGALMGAMVLAIEPADAMPADVMPGNDKPTLRTHEISRPAAELQLPGVILVTAVKG